MPNFHIPNAPISLVGGIIHETWRRLLEQLAATVTSQGTALASVPGVNRWALASQPTLGAGDAGYVAFVSDYGHFVRWTGTAWEFAPGDAGNGFFSMRPLAPQEVGWQLCDGTATDYLVVGGGTLTASAFTTPNLNGSAAYLKAAAAYTGTINAAGGASGATAPALSGSTASESSHTHTGVTGTENQSTSATLSGALDPLPSPNHTHNFTTGAGSAHSHGVGTLAVASHTHGIGTLDPANLATLVYFRR